MFTKKVTKIVDRNCVQKMFPKHVCKKNGGNTSSSITHNKRAWRRLDQQTNTQTQTTTIPPFNSAVRAVVVSRVVLFEVFVRPPSGLQSLIVCGSLPPGQQLMRKKTKCHEALYKLRHDFFLPAGDRNYWNLTGHFFCSLSRFPQRHCPREFVMIWFGMGSLADSVVSHTLQPKVAWMRLIIQCQDLEPYETWGVPKL